MPIRQKTLKLLVVEDNPAYVFLVKETLGHLKSDDVILQKEFAMNGAEALEKFRQFDPDVTFLDINLPDSSGLDLLEAFLEMREDAFITMLTTEAQASTVKQACDRGAQGYILKPFTVAKIKEAMTQYQNGSQKGGDQTRKKVTLPNATPVGQNFLQAVSQKNIEKNIQKNSAQSHVPTLEDVFKSWRILLADGDLGRQARILEELNRLGCRVRVASSGAHAWEVLRAEHFDIVLMDANLPEIDGYQLANQLRLSDEKKPVKTHVIALYANRAQINEKRMEFSGMADYFVSPLKVQKLRDTLTAHAKKFISGIDQLYLR